MREDESGYLMLLDQKGLQTDTCFGNQVGQDKYWRIDTYVT